jgi:hypothetical protein
MRYGKARDCALEGFMNTLKPFNYDIMYEEDIIRNYATIEIVNDRRIQWNMVMKMKELRRKREPNFPSFFHDEPNYLVRIEKMIMIVEALLKKGKQPQTFEELATKN